MEKMINIRINENELYTLQNILATTKDYRKEVKQLRNLFNNEVDLIENK